MSAEAWGIAGILATVIIGIPAYFVAKTIRSNRQSQKIGSGGVGFQAGRDNNVSTK